MKIRNVLEVERGAIVEYTNHKSMDMMKILKNIKNK